MAITTGLVVGALLGPLLVPFAALAAARLKQACLSLQEGGRPAIATAVAEGLTSVALLIAWSCIAYRVIVGIETTFARSDTTAGALVISHWLFAASLALVWPWGKRLARTLVAQASRRLRLAWRSAPLWLLPALLSIIVTVAAGSLVLAYKQVLLGVPWGAAIPLVGLIPGLALAGSVPHIRRRPWGPRLLRIARGLGLLLCAGAFVAALRLRPESTTARKIAFVRTLSGRVGYAAWTVALDFDRDGQINVLGGGDCAPFDPRRYAGAVEVPGNGIDEDCDGTDLPQIALGPRPRFQVGQKALPHRPNLIFLTIDALGAPRLSALGSPTSLMPHLDEFAGRSRLFTHCFSQGPSTRLSFPSIFTSRWDSQLAFEPFPRLPYSFASSERQLQDVLDDAGYDTVAIIPNDYFSAPRWPSLTRGFQRVDSSAVSAGKHNASQVTDAVLRVLSEQRDRPFYLWAHYYDAHPPYLEIPGVEYSKYGDEPMYDAELGYIDRELGRVLFALDQRTEPAYVFITSDHSTVFHPDPSIHRAHYGYDLYTATLHVPLMVHGPGIRPGLSRGVVSTMDIAPTIADMLMLEEGGPFEGNSLMAELLTAHVDPQRVLFHEFYLPERLFHGFDALELVSVRQDRYNLILDRVRGTYELYDWTADYFEQRDLYEELSRSPDVLRWKSVLGAFVEHFDRQVRPPQSDSGL